MKNSAKWKLALLASALISTFPIFAAETSAEVDLSPAGEGKTLPGNVVRVRLPMKFVSGSSAFSAQGKKEDSALQVSAAAGALVVEYGFSDAISLQLVAPFTAQNQVAMNGAAFQKTSLYKEKFDEFVNAAAVRLAEEGLCLSQEACVDEILNKNLTFPLDAPLTLPTGETLVVRAGVPLKDVAASLVTRAALPASGRTGLGDVEVGALFALADPKIGLMKKDWPFNVSVGAGLRLPTGSFTDVPAAQRGTGRGTVDLGLRANVDWHLHPSIVVSLQNQSELMLRAGKKRRSSLLDSTKLNSADTSVSGADGVANTADYERDGVRQIGFAKASFSLAALGDTFSVLLANAQWKYDFESRTTVGRQEYNPASELQSLQAGVTLDGLKIQLPLQLDVDYEIPVAGKNRVLAPSSLTSTLKVFYRF